MPRFVILEHDHPTLHWDFMLEAGAVLLTWRLSSPPAPHEAVAAEHIGDHRLIYLDYEGPVSGGRGAVTRWDSGEYVWLEEAEDWKVMQLRGRRLDGTFRLDRLSGGDWRGVFVV